METSDLSVIELNGMPRERGRHYGQFASSQIAKIVKLWRAELGSYSADSACKKSINPDAYLHEFLSQTNHLAALTQWVPELLEELKGIAEGADQPFENICGLQLLDEEWMFGMSRNLSQSADKCTAFAVSNQANNISYAGQNMDVGSWVDNKQVLLRVMPRGGAPEALIFSIAGNTGLNGLNAQGLGVTCNTLAQLNYSSDGLPVGAIVRCILSMQTIDEAEQFLRLVPHASGQNYILSSGGDMRCFECSANRVVRYQPESGDERIFHTNHPLVNDDLNDFLAPQKKRNANTVARLNSICTRLGDTAKTFTLEDIKAALAAHDNPKHPVSRNTNNEGSPIGYTAGSSIYELGDTPRLHLAAGPPCETAFEIFDFKTL